MNIVEEEDLTLGAYLAPADFPQHSTREIERTILLYLRPAGIKSGKLLNCGLLTDLAIMAWLVTFSYELPGQVGQEATLSLVVYEEVTGDLAVSDSISWGEK